MGARAGLGVPGRAPSRSGAVSRRAGPRLAVPRPCGGAGAGCAAALPGLARCPAGGSACPASCLGPGGCPRPQQRLAAPRREAAAAPLSPSGSLFPCASPVPAACPPPPRGLPPCGHRAGGHGGLLLRSRIYSQT